MAMEQIDHSSTVLIVIPVNYEAEDSIQSPSNLNAGLLTIVDFFDKDGNESKKSKPSSSASRSRESTPTAFPRPEIQLHLKLDHLPKDPHRGWLFGYDQNPCDVVLLRVHKCGISRKHFFLDFNWDSGYVRINNISQRGIKVEAPSTLNRPLELTGSDKRVLVPDEHTKIIVGSMRFNISWPQRDSAQTAVYQRRWAEFRASCLGAPLQIGNLNLEDKQDLTNFKSLRGSDGDFYNICQPIGKGSFGVVYRAVSLQDGSEYAAKRFSQLEERSQLEIKILKDVVHVRIQSWPFVLPYC